MSSEPRVLVPHWVAPEDAERLVAAFPDSVPPAAVERAATPAETRDRLPDAEVVVTFRFDSDLLADAPNLRWIQALSAGVDSYDREALADAGVALTNASGVHAEPIAEQVLGYMLAFERDLVTWARNQHRGVWERNADGVGELRGKTLGVVGLGAIGTRVAELGSALGMAVVGTKRDVSNAPDAVDEVLPAAEYRTLLRRADYAVLACPLTPETEGMVGGDEFRLMPSDAVLVNIARGGVVDQDALVSALQGSKIGGAALDVFETEPLPPESVLWDLSNVLLTPHMAGSTPQYLDRCAEIFGENYDRYVAGDPLRNRVD
jgi:phosphoglycerate dehydrogenase-like enzyme